MNWIRALNSKVPQALYMKTQSSQFIVRMILKVQLLRLEHIFRGLNDAFKTSIRANEGLLRSLQFGALVSEVHPELRLAFICTHGLLRDMFIHFPA